MRNSVIRGSLLPEDSISLKIPNNRIQAIDWVLLRLQNNNHFPTTQELLIRRKVEFSYTEDTREV